jgi:hypothetical protein
MKKEKKPVVARLHDSAAALSDVDFELMFVRGQAKRRKQIQSLWWQLMDDARDELLKQADKALGNDRTL